MPRVVDAETAVSSAHLDSCRRWRNSPRQKGIVQRLRPILADERLDRGEVLLGQDVVLQVPLGLCGLHPGDLALVCLGHADLPIDLLRR